MYWRDHDDETNVLEAVKKLNEVKGVRGIRRFFKQVAQSAKGTDQDDFLGCVTLPIHEVPSSGSDCWYKLAGRSSRSQVTSNHHSQDCSAGSRLKMNIKICELLLTLKAQRGPIENKQGFRRTNWKVNLRICELAKASNKENWSVQLICPAGPSSWSV